MSKPHDHKGFKRLFNAFFFSLAGLKSCLKTEEAFRLEAAAAMILIPLGLYLGKTPVEKILLSGGLLLLMIVELLNTAIERAIDRISYDRHDLSRDAKDMGSAAVLICTLIVAMTWILILV